LLFRATNTPAMLMKHISDPPPPLDRRRPDRAIDVLDEACAHLQAVTTYTPGAAAMILRRRELLRRQTGRGAGRGPGGGPGAGDSLGSGDGFETFARDGLSALQRFGAELEAIFTAAPGAEPVGPASPAPAAAEPEVETPAPAEPSLAVLDVELRSRLIADGVVVRGLDVARVVALATGQTVRWSE
ncbi:MAG: hypothetical protein ACLGIK_00090, partial [Gemmatimonadota bacterium]